MLPGKGQALNDLLTARLQPLPDEWTSVAGEFLLVVLGEQRRQRASCRDCNRASKTDLLLRACIQADECTCALRARLAG